MLRKGGMAFFPVQAVLARDWIFVAALASVVPPPCPPVPRSPWQAMQNCWYTLRPLSMLAVPAGNSTPPACGATASASGGKDSIVPSRANSQRWRSPPFSLHRTWIRRTAPSRIDAPWLERAGRRHAASVWNRQSRFPFALSRPYCPSLRPATPRTPVGSVPFEAPSYWRCCRQCGWSSGPSR